MTLLSSEQMKGLITKPKHKSYIDQAVRAEEDLVLHCEPILEKYHLPNQAMRSFTSMWRSLLTAAKYERFTELLTTPLETVSTTKEIFNQLYKFFDAQDRFIKYEFGESDIEADFQEYLTKINDEKFWRTKAFDALRIAINSYIVVDLPTIQLSEKPEPYYYFVGVQNVLDVDINKFSGNVEYILFSQSDTEIIGIDSGYYRKYVRKEKGDDSTFTVRGMEIPGDSTRAYTDYELESEVQHSTYDQYGQRLTGLGYTPVIDFYGCSISKTKNINKRGPITDVITKLNWLLYYSTTVKYYNMYGPFPIIVMYENKDKEFDEKSADNVVGIGAQYNQISPYDTINSGIKDPKTSKRDLVGAGSVITGPMPEKKDDPSIFSDGGPVKVIEMNKDNLQWVNDYVDQLEDEIVEICTGMDVDINNTQAKNQDQIASSFERKESILIGIKSQFERSRKFVVETVAKLRYGAENVTSITIDLGTDFFLKSPEQLTEEYDAAKKSGMNEGYLMSLRKAIINNKYRNNPDELERQTIMLDIEPYNNLTLVECQSAQLPIIDPVGYIIKLNFTNFVARFERENGNLCEFGSEIDYRKKIDAINKTIETYAKEKEMPVIEEPATNNKTKSKTAKNIK